jgi:mono/diheme cytochrome c family protein
MAGKHSTWHIVVVKVWILLALCAAGCEQRGAGSAKGTEVYQSFCATCHGPTGKPTEANVASMNVRDLTSPELRSRVTPALVENQVRKGSQNKLMPAFEGALTDEQIKAVSAYVASPEFLDRR